jgi:tetratricopeptide (TPR) repeat protein
VAELIEQLGDESYATRMRARESLQRIGLEAFDQLRLAQFHSDSEIAMSAKFLISSLMVSWSKESDPEEVRETLLEYGGCSESERSSRIDRLAEFPQRIGLPALVRITCYEPSLPLSDRAALALMRQPMADDAAVRRHHSEQILETLADNQRQAADWLRAYADDLVSGDYSRERWRQLIAQQRRDIDSAATRQASRESVLELVRVCATRAAMAGMREEAIELSAEHMDLIPPTTRGLVDACNWAIENGLHPIVLDLRQEHTHLFDRQALLLYSAAEAKMVAGETAEAEQWAQQASAISPLPEGPDEKGAMQPKEIEDAALSHREIGMKLIERGLFDWAEREFRMIIDSLGLDSIPAARARADLAEMLGELQRHQDVVDLLRPLVDRVEKDDKLKQRLLMNFFDYRQVGSNMEYHEALASIEQGDGASAKPKLVEAFRDNPRNVDILITMYRLEGDDAWRDLVMRMLEVSTQQIDQTILNQRDEIRRGGRDRDSEELLSDQLNQYAWLISNTEGNLQKALSYSLESIELSSHWAKLDTCARCYFAVGDLDNAIRMQKRALKLMPHSPPLRRQLEQFQAAQQGAPQRDASQQGASQQARAEESEP